MNLTVILESLQEDLARVGDLGDERAAAVARRLSDVLASTLRLKLFDVLSQAALEVSSRLPSGHVEVRLAGQEPELVFVEAAGESGAAVGEELSARISLRLPESLKNAVEKAADREGVSTNAWLVRAIARAAESRPAPSVGKRLQGYAQS
jgi:predicted HicB family RNase H-like nuclease